MTRTSVYFSVSSVAMNASVKILVCGRVSYESYPPTGIYYLWSDDRSADTAAIYIGMHACQQRYSHISYHASSVVKTYLRVESPSKVGLTN